MDIQNKLNRVPSRPVIENLDAITSIDGMTKAEVLYDLYKTNIIARNGDAVPIRRVVTQYDELVKSKIIEEMSSEEIEELMKMMESDDEE